LTATLRALLVGVGDYADEHIPDLPCVAADLDTLEKALGNAGYDVRTLDEGRKGLNDIRVSIQTFLAGARDGDTLLIYLNGHGVHFKGVDYIVPADARTAYRPFSELCVPLDCNRDIEEQSRAGDVVVFVDACREGFDEGVSRRTKSVGGRIGWSTGKVRRVAGQRIAYVFACSRGEVARFVQTEGGAFSVFTRALAELIADESGPSTLADLSGALQVRVDHYARVHGTRPQRIRVLGETDQSTIVIAPRTLSRVEERRVRADLAAAGQQLTGLERELNESDARYGHVGPRISGLAKPPDPDLADLQMGLDQLDELCAARMWQAASSRLATLSERMAMAFGELQAWRRAADAELAGRDDMRGELAAYEAKAGHLGLAEDRLVVHLSKAATDQLYSGGCDLEAARVVLDALREVLFRLTGDDR